MKSLSVSLSSRLEKVSSNDCDVVLTEDLCLPAAANGMWSSFIFLEKGVNGFERVLEAGPEICRDRTLLDRVRDEGPAKLLCSAAFLDSEFEELVFFMLIFGRLISGSWSDSKIMRNGKILADEVPVEDE